MKSNKIEIDLFSVLLMIVVFVAMVVMFAGFLAILTALIPV